MSTHSRPVLHLRAVALTTLAVAVGSPALVAAEATQTAQYRLRFEATWSPSTHPAQYPSGRAHFTPLIGGVHSAQKLFWQLGGLATDGVENMAETGGITPLDEEVQAAIDAGLASQLISGNGADTPGGTSVTFTVSQAFPLVTVTSMIAPSPDWFVGVSGYPLFQDGDWVQEKVVQLLALDAGTDNGTTFITGDSDTNPAQPIQLIDSGPLAGGVPLGTFTFTRLDTPPGPALALLDGRFLVRATYRDFELTRDDGQPMAFSQETGYFWFFTESNIEVLFKIIDGCDFNERYWFFASGLTNVEVEILVEDTETGQVNVYANPLGQAFQPIQDTDAFATCP